MSDVNTIKVSDLESTTDIDQEFIRKVEADEKLFDEQNNENEADRNCGIQTDGKENFDLKELNFKETDNGVDDSIKSGSFNEDRNGVARDSGADSVINNASSVPEIEELSVKENGDTESVNGPEAGGSEKRKRKKKRKKNGVNEEEGSIKAAEEEVEEDGETEGTSLSEENINQDDVQNNDREASGRSGFLEVAETASPQKQTSNDSDQMTDYTDSKDEELLTILDKCERLVLCSHDPGLSDGIEDSKKIQDNNIDDTNVGNDNRKPDIKHIINVDDASVETVVAEETTDPGYSVTLPGGALREEKSLSEVDSAKKPPSVFDNGEQPPRVSDNGEKPPSVSDKGEKPPSVSDNEEKPLCEVDNTEKPPSKSDNIEGKLNVVNTAEMPLNEADMMVEPLGHIDNNEKAGSDVRKMEKPPNVVDEGNPQSEVANAEKTPGGTKETEESFSLISNTEEQPSDVDNMPLHEVDNTEHPSNEVDAMEEPPSEVDNKEQSASAAYNIENPPFAVDEGKPQSDDDNSEKPPSGSDETDDLHSVVSSTENSSSNDVENIEKPPNEIDTAEEPPGEMDNKEGSASAVYNVEKPPRAADEEKPQSEIDNTEKLPRAAEETGESHGVVSSAEYSCNEVDNAEKPLNEIDTIEEPHGDVVNKEESSSAVCNTEKSSSVVDEGKFQREVDNTEQPPIGTDTTDEPHSIVSSTEKPPNDVDNTEKPLKEVEHAEQLSNEIDTTEEPRGKFDEKEEPVSAVYNVEKPPFIVDDGKLNCEVNNTEKLPSRTDKTEKPLDVDSNVEKPASEIDATEASTDNLDNKEESVGAVYSMETPPLIVDEGKPKCEVDNTEKLPGGTDTTEKPLDVVDIIEKPTYEIGTTEEPPGDVDNKEESISAVYSKEQPPRAVNEGKPQSDVYDTEKPPAETDTTEQSLSVIENMDKSSNEVDNKEMPRGEVDSNMEKPPSEVDNTEKQRNAFDDIEIPRIEAGDKEKPLHNVSDPENPPSEVDNKEKPLHNVGDTENPPSEIDNKEKTPSRHDNSEKQHSVIDSSEEPPSELDGKENPLANDVTKIENCSDTTNSQDQTVKTECGVETVGSFLAKVREISVKSTIIDAPHKDTSSREITDSYVNNESDSGNDRQKDGDNPSNDGANNKGVVDTACCVLNGVREGGAASAIAHMTLEQMQQQLQEQHTAMSRLQTHAHLQQVKANLLTTSLRAKLRRREQELKLLQSEHEQRISAVISHLLYLEGHMLKEHKEIIEILHNKDDIIRRQKTTIEDLTAKNDRYLEALKDGHIYPADNGLVTNLAHVTNLDTDVSTQDHDSMVILSENKNKQGEKVQGSGHKVRFSTMKDRLRRHKSSLELYQHEPLETLMESIPKYGSEENLAIVDNADKSKIINRKEKCRSLNDYPVVHRDLDDGLTESPDGYFTDFNIPTISRHDSTSSLVIFDEKTARRNDGLSSAAAYGFNELSKSRSVPHALPTVSENDSGSPNFKGRQKSLPSVEMLAKDMPTASTAAAISASSSMINIYPSRSPTNSSPPSESNPFKTFKNVFKRKGSKKKRPATLPSGKEQKQTLKQHFEKFDLR